MNSHSGPGSFELFPYTHANHFQFGYQNRSTLETKWLAHREKASDEFVAKYGRAQVLCTSWREANVLAAQEILKLCGSQNLQPVICYSGGLDSEIALVAFFEARERLKKTAAGDFEVPKIEIATLDLEGGLNRHDTDYVEKFLSTTRARGLDFQSQRYSLNIESFFKSEEFLRLAEETQVLSPAVISQIWLCEQIQSRQSQKSKRVLPVIAQGEMHLVRDEDLGGTYAPKPWSLVETENLCGLYRYFIGRGLPAVPGFFQFLPEQFESQLRLNPVIHELISHSRFGKLGTRTSKPEILKCDYPELEDRPKYTGFEKVEALYDERRAFLAEKNPAFESKWKLDVLTLANRLRPIAHAPLHQAEWAAAWGRDGSIASSRTDSDDIFATQWSDDLLLKNAFFSPVDQSTAHDEFLASLTDYFEKSVSSHQPSTFIFDGSHVGRLFAALAKRTSCNVTLLSAATLKRPTPAQLAALVMKTGVNDAETFSRAWPVTAIDASYGRLFIPLLHTKILNAEYDLELQSTLSRPRFVWTEFELLASVFSACERLSPGRCVFPWTEGKLAQAKIRATKAIGWFDKDEPGESNWSVFLDFLDECLLRLEESEADRRLAEKHANEFDAYKREIETQLRKLALPTSRFQVSAYELATYKTATANLASAFAQAPLPRDLKIVSTERWLEHARYRVPALRLGSNLFFQRRVSGFALFDKDASVSVALIDEATGEEVTWAQVSVLACPPNGRLRIRGVTTRADRERQGFASSLLKQLTSHLRAIASSALQGFTSIDVFAAPEVVSSFRAAGFTDDVTRMSRNAEIVSPETGRLTTVDYELTPLTFHLGKV